jgi:hypothetical protein
MLKYSKFSKQQLLFIGLIIGLAGAYILLKSFAAPNANLSGDLNNDNVVNITDLSLLLSKYGTADTAADINQDGKVTILDLSILLSHYGKTYIPPPTPISTYTPPVFLRNPYLASSFWYTPLPAITPSDSNSANIITNLKAQIAAHYGTFSINTIDYSPPFYEALDTTPTVKVGVWDCQNRGYLDAGLTAQFATVPMPSSATPAAGTDSELVVYQPTTNTMWEFWKMRKTNSGGWEACWGGQMKNVNQNPGIFESYYGTTATGLPFFGSTIMAGELEAGQINHALAIAMVDSRANVYSWPAARTDGRTTDPNTLLQGQRLRLDPSVNVDALNMSAPGKVIAKAIQKYGMVVRDTSGAVNLYAENATPYINLGKGNPYTNLFGGQPAYAVMNNFPWDKVQVLPKDYGK